MSDDWTDMAPCMFMSSSIDIHLKLNFPMNFVVCFSHSIIANFQVNTFARTTIEGQSKIYFMKKQKNSKQDRSTHSKHILRERKNRLQNKNKRFSR